MENKNALLRISSSLASPLVFGDPDPSLGVDDVSFMEPDRCSASLRTGGWSRSLLAVAAVSTTRED